MRILDKYLIKSFIAPLLYCVTMFVFLYVIIDLFGHLDEILRNKVSLNIIADYYLSLIPTIFVQTTPVAVLLSTVYSIGTLNRHNEITAMKSAGISVFKIIRPFLLMGIMFSIIIALVNERVVPSASVTATVIKQDKIERLQAQHEKNVPVIKDVALYGQENRMFYAKKFDPAKNILYDLIILEQDVLRRLKRKITSAKVAWSNDRWVFYDCSIYEFDAMHNSIGTPSFYKKTDLGIPETPKDFLRAQFKAEHMNYETLQEYIKKLAEVEPRTAKRLSVDLHYKTAFPFITFVIVFIGAAMGLRTGRGGVLFGIGTSVAISFAYYAIMAISIALGKGEWLNPMHSAWLANVLFILIGTLLLK